MLADYDPSREAIQTFLRIRPASSSVILHPPHLSQTSETQITLVRPSQVSDHYFFTLVLPSHTTQADTYSTVAFPLVKSAVEEAQDALLFAYGVTNSGKTFSVQGTPSEPGLVPRILSDVFQAVGKELVKADNKWVPEKVASVDLRGCPIRFESLSKDCAVDASSLSDKNLQAITSDSSRQIPRADRNYEYAIFISYLEIYNEHVYDLLSPETFSAATSSDHNASQKKKKSLPLKSDKDERSKYVSGLTHVRCDSASQAVALLRAGSANRTVFGTKANAQSSRSHSVFQIKILRSHKADPTEVTVCRLSVVDLAGNERSKSAATVGMRLKEAGNINTSLMRLGMCMEALRENQRRGPLAKPVKVPFSQSKLTELFQSFLTGHGKAVMVVHVNPFDTSFEENSHAMKFSAVARDVTVLKPPSLSQTIRKQPSLFGRAILNRMTSGMKSSTHNFGPGGGISSNAASTLGRTDASSMMAGLPDFPTASEFGTPDIDESFQMLDLEDGITTVQYVAKPRVSMYDDPEEEEEEEGEEIDSEEKSDESPFKPDPLIDVLAEELYDMKCKWAETEVRCAELITMERQETASRISEALAAQEKIWEKRLLDTQQSMEEQADLKLELLSKLHTSHLRRLQPPGAELSEILDAENIDPKQLKTKSFEKSPTAVVKAKGRVVVISSSESEKSDEEKQNRSEPQMRMTRSRASKI